MPTATVAEIERMLKTASPEVGPLWTSISKRIRASKWRLEAKRANRTLMLNLFQWGLAVLVGMETCLYYVRRDVANNMAQHHALPSYGTVPPVRWFVGTTLVMIVALILCSMNTLL